MKRISDESFMLSTGKVIHPNDGVIGLAEYKGRYRLFGGFDDEFWLNQDTSHEKYADLTNAEAKEIAIFMVVQWTNFAATLKL